MHLGGKAPPRPLVACTVATQARRLGKDLSRASLLSLSSIVIGGWWPSFGNTGSCLYKAM